MKRRKFIFSSGSAILTGGFALSQSQHPAVGLNFELTNIPDKDPKNVDSLVVDFNKLEITPQYLDESQSMTIESKLDISGHEENEPSGDTVFVTNGETKQLSDTIGPMVADGIDTDSSISGTVTVTIDHPDIKDSYSRTFIITDSGTNTTDSEIDYFEEGSASPNAPWNSWFSRTGSGSLTAQSETVISGSSTGEQVSNSDFRLDETERDSATTSDLEFKFFMSSRSGKGGADYFRVSSRDSTDVRNSKQIHGIEYRYNGEIIDNNTQTKLGTWQTDVANTVKYVNDFPNNQYEVIFNGSSLGTVGFSNSASEQGSFSMINSTEESFTTQSVFVDDIKEII